MSRDAKLLTESLEHIQQTTKQILKAARMLLPRRRLGRAQGLLRHGSNPGRNVTSWVGRAIPKLSIGAIIAVQIS